MSITQVSSSDYGKYECHAKNDMGQDTGVVNLEVTSPPDQPSNLTVVNVTHDTATLIWEKGFDGGLPTSHQLRWRETDEDRYHYMDVAPGEYKAVVTGLSLGTYYLFSVKAINSKGESHFLPDLVKAQTLSKYD